MKTELFPVAIVTLLLRWTILLSLAWTAHALLRKMHSHWRVILWRSALCFALILPFAHFVPSNRLPTVPIYVDRFSLRPESAPLPELGDARVPAAQNSSSAVIGRPVPVLTPANKPSLKRFTSPQVLGGIWAFGFCLAVARLLRMHFQLRCLRRASQAAPSQAQELCDQIAAEFSLPHAIIVRASDQVNSPFVCGLFRTAVILPSALAKNLPAADVRLLLRHELAHVRQHDLAWNLAWRWATAALWFHPFVWRIAPAHNLACEHEADRLASGPETERCSYSQALARVALRVVSLPAVETTLTLNGSAEIVRRLDHLAAGNSGPWTRGRSVTGYSLALLLVLAAGGWQISHGRPAPSKPFAPTHRYEAVTVTVEDDAGKPIEGATVEPYAFRVKGSKFVDHYGWDRGNRKKHLTDAEGKVYVRYPVVAFPEEKLYTALISFIVAHPDYAQVTADIYVDKENKPVRLTPGLRLHVSAVGGSDGKAVTEVVPTMSGEPMAEWRTNENGVLTCHQVAPGPHLLQLMGRLPNGEIGYSIPYLFTARRSPAGDVIEAGNNEFHIAKGKAYELTFDLKPGVRVEGRLDGRVPRPVRNGRVVVSVRPPMFPAATSAEEIAGLHKKLGGVIFWKSYRKIQEDGMFVFESVPAGELDVVVIGDGFVSKNGGQAANKNGQIPFAVPQSFSLQAPITAIEVATEPTATIAVTVKTENGEPVENASIDVAANIIRMQTGYLGAIEKSNEAAFRRLPMLPELPPSWSGKTDAEGRVTLENIPATAHWLEFGHPDFQIPVREKWTRSVKLALHPGETEKIDLLVQAKGKQFLGELLKGK